MGAFEITGSDGITYMGRTQDIPEMLETDPQFTAAYNQGEPIGTRESNMGGIALFGDTSPAFSEDELRATDAPPIFTTINPTVFKDDRK